MLGQQDPIPKPPLNLPAKLMDRGEQALWDRALVKLDELEDTIALLQLLSFNAALTWAFAQKHGLPMTKPDQLESQLIELEAKVNRTKELMRKAEDRELGVQFRNGDIDIVDPSGQHFGAVLLIVGGVIVLAGLVAALYHYKTESDEIRPKYNNLLAATDAAFCKPGSPDTCAEWKAYRKSSGYTARKSLAEKIGDEIGSPVKTGLQWGVAAGIAILALTVSNFIGRK